LILLLSTKYCYKYNNNTPFFHPYSCLTKSVNMDTYLASVQYMSFRWSTMTTPTLSAKNRTYYQPILLREKQEGSLSSKDRLTTNYKRQITYPTAYIPTSTKSQQRYIYRSEADNYSKLHEAQTPTFYNF
jgi:hypothetical protein